MKKIMTRVVVHDRRFNQSLRGRYTLDIRIHYASIPDNIPLSSKVLKQYKETKNLLGYTTFRGLNQEDIESIFSAVHRQEAHLNVDRMGNAAFYKLDKKVVK